MFDDLIAAKKYKKRLHNIVTELFLKEKNSIFHLFLYHNLISKCLKL